MNYKLKNLLNQTSRGVVAITVIAFWFVLAYIYWAPEDSLCVSGENVAVVKMHGTLDFIEDPYSSTVSVDPIVELIDSLSRNKSVEVIILDTYSHGGLASAGEVVMNSLKRSPKKTIALIKESGVSSAYLAASGADEIYATRLSQVGSIGTTISFLDATEMNIREGLEFVSIASAEFKDMFHPDKPLTEREREKFVDLVEKSHVIFVQMIAENRGLSIEEVDHLADGSVFLAEEAVNNNLIDGIGDEEDVLEMLSKEGTPTRVCRVL